MTRHLHVCRCGNFMVCHQEPDRCPMPKHWTCEVCEDQARDDYFTAQLDHYTHQQEQEHAHGKSH